MVAPEKYLPGAVSELAIQTLLLSLDLPKAASIRPLQVTAEYHSIYLLDFTREASLHIQPNVGLESNGTACLVLRISGKHLPRIKTANEVAVMRWVRQNTHIPIPNIVRFDDSEENAIEHEFTLLEKVPGRSVDEVYDTLNTASKHSLVSQLADFLAELHSHAWDFIGGLQVSSNGQDIIGGPVVDETFWQAPDILKYWDEQETIETLNVAGPYQGYTDFSAASIDRYVYAIEKRPSLVFMRDLVPRLRAFAALLRDKTQTDELGLNNIRLVLAHKDMHFANTMFDPDTNRITGILDWEFAGVVPASRWNPVKAFLWNGQRTPESKTERADLEQYFQDICTERGISVLKDAEATPLQESMQKVLNYVRAIVEVSPRGEKAEEAIAWRKVAEDSMMAFGI